MMIKEFIDKANAKIETGGAIVALTDEYIVDKWPMKVSFDGKEEKILEFRVFSDKGEMKLSRTDIGKVFSEREIFDDEDTRDSFDEDQFLDIDEKAGRSDEGMVYATGGGKYNLPLERIKDAKLKIRYYLGKYSKTGQVRVEDWRVVGFVEGK